MTFTRLPLLFISVVICRLISAQSLIESDSIWREIDLADVVVTAQYAPTDTKNAVHQVKVIKGIDIQRQGQINLAEVLTNQLNLRVSTDPILGNGLQIQGIGGENIQIMIDGVPVIGRVGGNIDLSQINLHNVDRIEIIEGAMSAQYGSNASGGVINIITKKSQLERFRLESRNQYEDIGIWNHSLMLSTQFNEWYLSVNGSRYQARFAEEDSLRLYRTQTLPSGETFRSKVHPWNPKVQHGLDGTLRYRPSDSLNITYQYRYFDEQLDRFGERRRPQFKPYAFDEIYTTKRQDHSLNLESYLGSFYLNSTTAFNQFDRIKQSQRLDFETGETTPLEGEQDTTSFTSFLHRSIISTLSTGRLNGQLGVEVLAETGSGLRIIDSTSTPLNRALLSNYAAWLGLKYQPAKDLTLSANLRYGHNTRYDHPLIPSFHVNWQPHEKWNVKLSYAHGFRAPSLKELFFNFIDINHFIVGNPDLKPENSRNASGTVQYDGIINGASRFSLQAKVFYNHIRDPHHPDRICCHPIQLPEPRSV